MHGTFASCRQNFRLLYHLDAIFGSMDYDLTVKYFIMTPDYYISVLEIVIRFRIFIQQLDIEAHLVVL